MGYMQMEGEDGEHHKLSCLEKCQYLFRKTVEFKSDRRLILVIVFVALFLDNMLLTVVVPIIPDYLWYLNHQGKVDNNRGNCSKELYKKPDISVATFGRHSSLSKPPLLTNESSLIKSCQEDAVKSRHEEILVENVQVGLMFASKATIQLLTNPFVGPLTNRIGYSVPMFIGFCIMFVSTIVFAFAESFVLLVVARCIQGLGSAFSTVAGMGMLASAYTDDAERGNAFGIALSGLAMGVLVGPSFGGIVYQFSGKETPFLILAVLVLFDGALQLFALNPKIKPEVQEGASLKVLLKDPYILIAAGSITLGNIGIAMLEPSLPLWMKDTMNADKWELGIAFLPCSISYLVGTAIFGRLAQKFGRWLCASVGLIICAICLFCIPMATKLVHLFGPNFFLGLAIGMVDSSMLPIMGYLVDLRHVSVYGSVYAIADVAFCLGFAAGPAISGTLVKAIGFKWMIWTIAITNIAYSWLNIFLRNPPARNEKTALALNSHRPTDYQSHETETGTEINRDPKLVSIDKSTQ